MNNEIFEYLSSRIGEAETAENSRIKEIAHELCRRCSLHEEEYAPCSKHVDARLEQCVTEEYAKSNNYWISIQQVFELGLPGPSGNENDTYVSNGVIYKVNNLLNSRGSLISLFYKILLHNHIFIETAYEFVGFTGFQGTTVMPIFKQNLIANAVPATQIEIDTYMAALGFETTGKTGSYKNKDFLVWDVLPRNVLKDAEGDIFVIDAEIQLL